MHIIYNNGIEISDGKTVLYLDPKRKAYNALISHAHMDHISGSGIATQETNEIIKYRRKNYEGINTPYYKPMTIGDLEVELYPAGHVLGSAMIRVNDILYTGDFNPEGCHLCDAARPKKCETLIIDSTYGLPEFKFPQKKVVIEDLITWVKHETSKHGVIIGAYEFGKAQEIIAHVQDLNIPIYASENIVKIAEIYNKFGHALNCNSITEFNNLEEGSGNDKDRFIMLLPTGKLRTELVYTLRRCGARTAYVSGWCLKYSFNVDAQFPLSDHADFNQLIRFVQGCNPERVFTVGGYAPQLAEYLKKILDINASSISSNHFERP